MVITRISTYNTHQQTIGNAIGVQGRLFELQKQISSGFKTDQYEGLFGEVEAFTSLEDKMSRAEEFLKNNSIIASRTNLMSQAVDSVIDIATQTRNLILTRRNGTANENLGFLTQLENQWKTLAGQLNVSVEGRYLFGGIRTDRPPVDADTNPYLSNAEGIPEDNYYLGADQGTVIRLEDNFDLTINAKANDPAIQKIYAGFALARAGHSEGDDDKIALAFDTISEGLDEMSLIQVDLASTNASLAQTADRQNRQVLYWRGIKDELISTDLVSASSEVALNEGILQATFQAFARINSLNLGDFLR